MDINSNYIEWIDVAKGLGIILVIAGHTFCLGISSPLYTFHMPLFFLLSGVVFNENKYKSPKYLLKMKAKQILKPWTIMAMISLMVCLCIPEWRHNLSLKTMLIELYTANTNNIQNSSLWYLLCLYMMFVLYIGLSKLKGFKYRLIIIIILAVSVLFFKNPITWISNKYLHLPDNRLPFKIDTAVVAVVFFIVGLWYQGFIKKIASKTISWIVLFTLATLVYAAGKLNGWTNLNSLDFGNNPLLFYPIAFSGIWAVIFCSNKIISVRNLINIADTLKFYGKNSLVIFGFQSLFIRLYLLIFNHLQGTDMQLYQNYNLYHQVGAFVVVTFVISPLMVKTLKRLTDLGLKMI